MKEKQTDFKSKASSHREIALATDDMSMFSSSVCWTWLDLD